MDNKLNILITGGGSGIGEAIAKDLDYKGHNVIICGRDINKLKNTAKKTNIKYLKCDVSDENQVKKLLIFTNKLFLKLDVLINAAAVIGTIGRFDKVDSKSWIKTIQINLFGTYYTSKHFLNLIKKSKIKKIINFSGGGAFGDFPNYSSYACSKSAVVRLSENMAAELIDESISVNCIAPGFVSTNIHDETLIKGPSLSGLKYYNETLNKLKKGSVPMSRVIGCLNFLISPKSNGLSGKTISASFDKWDKNKFTNNIELIQNSELYSMRRINLRNFDINDEINKKIN